MNYYFTKEGLAKLEQELDYLKKIKRREIAEKLEEAASFGDLSENFAYQQAREDQEFLEKRIAEIEEMLKKAIIIEKKKSEKVQVGSIVTVIFKGEKHHQKFQIVGTKEANPAKFQISLESPLGKALWGKKKGDKIKIEIGGKMVECEVIRVE